MGSPQCGRPVLDGALLPTAREIEYESLTWSRDRRLLAVQELASWGDGPKTRES